MKPRIKYEKTVMETVNRDESLRESGNGANPVQVILIEYHSGVSFQKALASRERRNSPVKGNVYRQINTCPYSVTGGANVKIAFVLLQDGSFFIFGLKFKGGICCVSESRYEPEFCGPRKTSREILGRKSYLRKEYGGSQR